MPFYQVVVIILVVGCIWIWGAYEAEQWLEKRERNPYIRLLSAAALGLVWPFVALGKLWWRAKVRQARDLLSILYDR